jgi:predicted HD phosphohydrolase
MQIKLTSLETGTAEEFRHLEELERALDHDATSVMLDLLRTTDRETGYPISPMQHCLQTATRAARDGASEELIVAALLHDVADAIAPNNHGRVGAEMLRPFISERTYWVMANHSVFQGYYYWHHIGKDRNTRDQYRSHPDFEACALFCERWDQNSFDPRYDTMPLEAFIPAVTRILSREPCRQGTGR